jgi:hypothetical protein
MPSAGRKTAPDARQSDQPRMDDAGSIAEPAPLSHYFFFSPSSSMS